MVLVLCVLTGCTGALDGGNTLRVDATVDSALLTTDAGVDGQVLTDAGMDSAIALDAGGPAMDATIADAGSTDATRPDGGTGVDGSTPISDGSISDAFLGGGTLFYTASFQGASIPSSVFRDMVASDSLTLVAAPWDGTRQALRVLIRGGENWNDAGYPRSEITPTRGFVEHFVWEQRYRITGAFGFNAGAEFPNSGSHGIGELVAGFQIHGDDNDPPVLALQLHNGNLQLQYRPTDGRVTGTIVDCGVAPTGVRIPYEIVYVASGAATGYIHVAVGDSCVLEQDGPSNRIANDAGGFMKYGLYDPFLTVETNTDPSLVIYLDDIQYYRY